MVANPVVHIVDDDEAVRRSLAFMLSSAGDFLDGLDDLQCGCLITDVRMPEMSGIELLRRIKEQAPCLPTIVITGHGDVPLAVEAMKAGAIDFIEKPFDETAILDAVKTALERTGDVEADEDRAEVATRLATLSERERQVLDGLVAGHANKAIANALGISPRTVEVYRANLMAKMQAKSLSELIRMAILAQVPRPKR
jgi:two-component system response regulator FixJ